MAPSREVARVLSVLPDEGLVIVVPAGDGDLASAIAGRRPRASVVALTHDASAAAAVRDRLAGCANADVAVGASLDAVAGRPAAVVAQPTGFEGMPALDALFADAHDRLELSGRFTLVVHTKRGAVRLAALLEARFGNLEVLKGGGTRVLTAVKTLAARPAPPGAAGFVEFEDDGRRYLFHAGPALFSKGRVDPGATLLLDCLRVEDPRSIVDLGCGYGALGIVLAGRHPSARVVMVDVDARAVEAARANAERNGVAVDVVLRDGPAPEDGPADLVVTNLPLHVPKDTQRRLVTGSRDALRPGGRLWLCAHASWDVRPLVQDALGHVDTVLETLDRSDPGERYRVLRSSLR